MGAAVALTVVLTALQQANLLRGRIISSTLSSARFLRHLLRLPVTFFAQRNPADLVQRLQSNDSVAETLARDLAAAGVDAVVVVLYAVLLWTYDPQLTLVGDRCIALLNVVAMRVVVRLRGHRHAEAARRHRPAHQHLLQRPAAHRDDEGHRRRERLLPPLGRPARHHPGRPSRSSACPPPSLAVVAPTLAALNSA